MKNYETRDYVTAFFSSDTLIEKFFNNVVLLYGNGNGQAEITYSAPQLVDVSLFNDEKERLVIIELTNFDLEIKWVNSKVFVEPNMEPVKRLWLKFLKNTFADYEAEYSKHHLNFIQTL